MKKPRRDQRPDKPRKVAKKHAHVTVDTPLTEKEKLFVVEYLKDLNGSQAYHRSHPGCTYGTCRVNATKLLAKTNVRASVDAAIAQRKERIGMEADEIMQNYRRMAETSMADFVTFFANGRIKLTPSSELSADQLACVQEISRGKDGAFKFRLYSRKDALEALQAHAGAGKAPQPGDPNTVTHFHTAIPFDKIREKAEGNK